MTYRSITVSGPIASGTTTAAKTLAKKYNLEFHYAGDFFRQYMKEHNIPLFDKSQIPDNLDQQIDKQLTSLAASEKPVIIDGHYIGYFTRNMPHVLRVRFVCDNEERFKRALNRPENERETEDIIKKREEGIDAKFRKLYANEDFLDPKFFDLTVDTTLTQPEDVVGRISKEFEK